MYKVIPWVYCNLSFQNAYNILFFFIKAISIVLGHERHLVWWWIQWYNYLWWNIYIYKLLSLLMVMDFANLIIFTNCFRIFHVKKPKVFYFFAKGVSWSKDFSNLLGGWQIYELVKFFQTQKKISMPYVYIGLAIVLLRRK